MPDDSPSLPFWQRLFSRPQPAVAAMAPSDHARQTRERQLLARAASFASVRVADVMVPRADIVAVEIDTPLAELARLFADAQHSRLPVYRETLDDPVGFVHIKEVMTALTAADMGDSDCILPRVKRDVLFAPASMPAADLLLRMQTKRAHMALVVDEFGGTDGLVTLEDLVEQVFGDISDEHDTEEAERLTPRPDGSLDADARIPIAALEQHMQQALRPDDLDEDVDTIGGLVYALAGRIPHRGEVIAHPTGPEFEILDADPRRIKRVRVRVQRKAS